MGEEKLQVENKEELTPDQIRQLPGDTRAKMCAFEINENLKKFNCILSPQVHMTNNGYHIEAKITGVAYSIQMPQIPQMPGESPISWS